MLDPKKSDLVFDPKDPVFRYKLWMRADTPAGPRLFIIWRHVVICLVALLLLGWLVTAGALWGFVKYQRGITDAKFVDLAFYPLRRAHYRETLARHHLATAKAQIEKQAWSDALLSLRVALGNAPRDLEIRRLLAELYVLFRRPELARQVLEDGLPFAANDVAYLRQTFGYLRAQRQAERVVTLGSKLLPATPDIALPHRVVALQIALACLELKRFDDAETFVTRWRLDQAPEGQLLLADLAVARGQPELAIARLRARLERDPKSEAFSVQLTKLYLQLGRIDEARRVALTRSFDHPDSPGAHIDLLNLLHQSGEPDDFDREFTRYLDSFSSDPKALLMLAVLAADQARPDLCTRILAVIRPAGQGTGPFLFALMQAQCSARRYTDALQTALALEQTQDLPYRTAAAIPSLKAWAYFGLNNEAEGEVWLQRFLTQRQFNPADALRLATALGHLGDDKQQLRVLTAAAELQPPADAAVIALANYHVERNAWAEAGERLPQLRAVVSPPDELIQTIQWHLNAAAGAAPPRSP